MLRRTASGPASQMDMGRIEGQRVYYNKPLIRAVTTIGTVFQKVHLWNLPFMGEFLGAKIFPDKFCLGTCFALKRLF